MGETSNFYEKCSSLSKKGDEKSLRTLLQMGISGNKTARVALRKTRNKKLGYVGFYRCKHRTYGKNYLQKNIL